MICYCTFGFELVGEIVRRVSAGGIAKWADPVQEMVGYYFSVDLGPISISENYLHTRADFFINVVTAAIVEK